MNFVDFLILEFHVNNEPFYKAISRQDLRNGYVNIYAEDEKRHHNYIIAKMPIDSCSDILRRSFISFSNEEIYLKYDERQELLDKYPNLKFHDTLKFL